MVALKGKAITDFVARRNPNIHAVLIYGPDQGLVRERIEKIALQVVPDLNDPFNTIEISESELKANPTRLTDEIMALSFMGGERIIRYRANGEAAGDGVSNFIKNLDSGDYQPNGVVIISGGELSPRSSLRKLFEKSKNSAALPCYIDGPQAVRTLAQSMAQEQGLEFERHALDFVTMTLGEDRALTRSELEKLILYKSPGKQQNSQSSTITIDDVKASLVDRTGDAMNNVTAACLDANSTACAAALFRCATSGVNPISILLAIQRATTRLREARSYVEQGVNPNEAMKKLRPPVFFGEKDAFRQRLNSWSLHKLNFAKHLLTQAEFSAKTTGNPQREIVERTALQISRLLKR